MFGLLGCSNPNEGSSVAVLGDSITTFDQADMTQQLGKDYKLTISGNYGKTVEQVIPEAEVVSTRTYDQVIFNLGTNDSIGNLPTASSMDFLKQMISMFPDAKCIHLVNINENMVDIANGQSVSAAAERFNKALEELVGTDQRLSIVDWNAETAATLNDKSPRWSTLTKDSVHPTEEGNRKLNALYAGALRACDNPLGL
jgi:lysophospholipase L1-like esterase